MTLMEYFLLAVDANELGAVVGVTAGIGMVGGALKLVWNYWTGRLEKVAADHATELTTVRDAHKEDRGEQTSRYTAILGKKDDRIEELQKELSKKSDELAAKIEELQGVTMQKMEQMMEKNVDLFERQLEQSAQFTAMVSNLKAQSTGDGNA